MSRKREKNKSLWRLWCKAMGQKASDCDKESDVVAIIRTFIFITYLITNVAIVANAVRHWNDNEFSNQGFTTHPKYPDIRM
tara:strand:+ start:177 stop:419 length:243 start_codon:yes stop_codon:yes gene_type:complete